MLYVVKKIFSKQKIVGLNAELMLVQRLGGLLYNEDSIVILQLPMDIYIMLVEK